MNPFVDITNRDDLAEKLTALRADTKPLFGTMDAQRMVEHLITAVEYTNGTHRAELEEDTETANQRKQRFIYTSMPMPRGLKSPGSERQSTYRFASIEMAVSELFKQLDILTTHFNANPGITEIHPGMGPFNYAEWVTFHNKHFTHHLAQFGLY